MARGRLGLTAYVICERSRTPPYGRRLRQNGQGPDSVRSGLTTNCDFGDWEAARDDGTNSPSARVRDSVRRQGAPTQHTIASTANLRPPNRLKGFGSHLHYSATKGLSINELAKDNQRRESHLGASSGNGTAKQAARGAAQAR